MTDLKQRIKAFVKLGEYIQEYCKYAIESSENKIDTSEQHLFFDEKIKFAEIKNNWFTKENILFSFKNWSDLLSEKQLNNWLSTYNIPEENNKKTIALILAGNIPLVGFHDFLASVIVGNKALVKLSSNDAVLLPLIANKLLEIEPLLKDSFEFIEGKLENFDAVIATGSNNTARYFEHYFSKKPNIIRKNRNSVAILTGKETPEQLKALGEDVFRYYGLGCRSVSKLFVPKDYNFDAFFSAIYDYNPIINQFKYANNYDYNKAVYLMSNFKLLENGFLILKEDTSYSSPIASLFYEHYNTTEELKQKLQSDKEKLQCTVSNGFSSDEINFGETQNPSLTDYADGIDTLAFLLTL